MGLKKLAGSLLALWVMFSSLEAGKDGKGSLRFEESEKEPSRKRPCRRPRTPPLSQVKAQETTDDAADVQEKEERVETSSPERERLKVPSFSSLEAWEEAVASAAAEQRVMGLQENIFEQENYQIGVFEIALGFERMSLPQEQWEAEAQRLGAIPWPSQTAQATVGAHVFFHASIDEAQCNLLRNTLRPLLFFARGEKSFEEAYEDVSEALPRLLENHCYFTRRVALYGLTEAARQGHPIARLIVVHVLYDYAPWELVGDLPDRGTPEAGSALHPYEKVKSKARRFFTRQNILIQTSLREATEQLKTFLDVPGIEAFIDLPYSAFKDLPQVQEKASLGLVRYIWLLGEYYRGSSKFWDCDKDRAHKALQAYHMAIEKGDWEGARALEIDSHIYWEALSEEEKGEWKRYIRRLPQRAPWLGQVGGYYSGRFFPTLRADGVQLPLEMAQTFEHVQLFLRAKARHIKGVKA